MRTSFIRRRVSALGESDGRSCAGVGWLVPSCISAISIGSLLTIIVLDYHDDNTSSDTSPSPHSPIGWLALLGACLIYGSFGFLIKAPAVVSLNAGSGPFQVFTSLGVTLTLLGSIAAVDQTGFHHFSWWGVLAGLLYVVSNTCSTAAIPILGYGVACTIWAGITIVVSFLWGACVLHQKLRGLVGSLLGLMILLTGVTVAARVRATFTQTPVKAVQGLIEEPQPHEKPLSPRQALTVMTFGAMLNGSLTVPYGFFVRSPAVAAVPFPEFAYLISFAAGVALVTLGFIFVALICQYKVFHSTLMLPGFLTGLYWGCGNVCALFATKYLGNTVGYPLCQCCIIISGLWGIFYYQELTGYKAISFFFLSVAMILGGAVILAQWALP